MSHRRSSSIARTCGRYAALVLLGLLAWACAGAPDGKAGDHDAELVGRFETYVVDHADGTFREEYALALDTGARVELVFRERPNLRSGERARLRGRYVSNALPLSSRDGLRLGATRFQVTRTTAEGSSLGKASQALVNPPTVSVKSAVVLLNFNGMEPQGYRAEDARRELDEVEAYYQEISYGSWTMESDVFGPYNVEAPAMCELSVLGELAKATARAQGIDIDSYDHVGVKIGGVAGQSCPCAVAFLG